MKRLTDIVAAGLGLFVLSPLLAIVALLVRCGSSGPALFRQERMGRNFRPFQILKFRTMVQDAPQRGGPITVARRPPHHAPRRHPSQDQTRRTAATDQCGERGHESGRSSPGSASLRRDVPPGLRGKFSRCGRGSPTWLRFATATRRPCWRGGEPRGGICSPRPAGENPLGEGICRASIAMLGLDHRLRDALSPAVRPGAAMAGPCRARNCTNDDDNLPDGR